MRQHFDRGSLFIIMVTFLLFLVALFVKGMTKNLLLEAGVLLVSVKLILMAYKNSVTSERLQRELEEIKTALMILLEKK